MNTPTAKVPLPDEPDAVLRLAGALLGEWRKHTGLSRETFGERVGYGTEMVASVERGRRIPSVSYLTAADAVCDAHGTISVMEPHIRERPRTQQELRNTEESSSALSYFAPTVLPDLFHVASDDLDDTGKGRRQQILGTGAPICLVLDQAVLLRAVGCRMVHIHQLQHLADLAERPHLIIQVLPLAAGRPLALATAVTLLRRDDHQVGFVDGGFWRYWLAPEAVREAEQRFSVLRSVALPPRASRDLILNTVEWMER